MLFGRFLLAYQWPQTLNGPSTEWLRGQKLCTYRGRRICNNFSSNVEFDFLQVIIILLGQYQWLIQPMSYPVQLFIHF
jgi:hypothetical protein